MMLAQVTPLFLHNQDILNSMTSPAHVIDYDSVAGLEHVLEVIAAEFDYIPPELVDLYVTNTGAHQPSYIYRMLAEYYNPNDVL
jgi:translation initiation factor eIF-2B subunit beta